MTRSTRSSRSKSPLVFVLLSVLGILPSLTASAQNSNIANQRSFFDRAVLSFKGVYAGPSIGAPNGFTTDSRGALNKKPQCLDSTLKIGYTVAPELVAAFALNFDVMPVANAGASLKPPHLLLDHGSLVKVGGFRWSGDLRFYLPIGDRAAVNATQFGVRTTHTVSYKLTPDLSIASENMVRVWSFGSGGTGSRSDLEVRVSPFATYRFSDTIAATLWSDLLSLDHPLNAAPGLQARLANLQPGVRFDFGKSVSFNPFINLIPGNMSIDTTTLGFLLNARLI